MIGNGYADVKKIEGNTIVWNQLHIDGNTETSNASADTRANNPVIFKIGSWSAMIGYTQTLGKVANIITAGASATEGALFISGQSININISYVVKPFVSTHKYLISYVCTENDDTTVGGYKTINRMVIDLTKMFGETVANSMTVEEFERLFPMEYAPYCEGRLVSLGGYNIKWNQLVTQDVPQDFTGGYGTTVRKTQFGYFPVIAEHKYYCKLYGTNVPAFYGLVTYNTPFEQISTTVQSTSPSYIFTSNRTTQAAVWTYESSSESYTNVLANVIDLTEMFGPGSEPTIEEFEAMFGTEYRPYDEGTEMNVLEKMELQDDLAVKSTGFNLWDEQWEVGTYDISTGQKIANLNMIRSKNRIEVFPNTVYYLNINGVFYFYDANESYISYSGRDDNGNFTTPSNCKYARFRISSDYGTTYKNDICINLSDPAKNGTYLPYTTSTQDLSFIYDLEYTPEGSTTPEKLFPYGLLSAGSVHDEITDTGAVKRVGVVDLGSLTWDREASVYAFAVFRATLSDSKAGDGGGRANIVSSKYPTIANSAFSVTNPGIGIQQSYLYTSKYVIIRDDSHSTAPTTSDNWLDGVMLYYELATPITITFPTPKDLGYNVQSGGTEQLLPSNPAGTGPITAPIIESVNYPLDAVGTLTNLPKNYISVESMDSFTTALGNAMNLNITKTWDATNNKWTFSVTSRS